MSRRRITVLAFVAAIVLTIVGFHYCNHKVVPLVRIALWFPLPYLLDANGILGVVLAWGQFPILAYVFTLAIRRCRARWVLVAYITTYGLYAATVLSRLGPPR